MKITDQTEKERVFISYIDSLYKSGRSYGVIGRYIKYVRLFIDSSEPVSRKGYKNFITNNAVIASEDWYCKEALLSFLDYAGIGYNRRKKAETVKPLQRIVELSDKNRKIINDFILSLVNERDYSTSTIQTYRYGLQIFFEYSTEFNQDSCRRFIQTLESQGLKPSTLRLRITALEKLGEFLKKPVKIKRPKFRRNLNIENVPSEKDYKNLLDYLQTLPNKDYYYWIKTLATTGARISEFLQFKWEDIERGDVILKGKGSKYRRFFFQKSLQQEITAYIKANHKSGPLCIARNGQIMTTRGFAERLKSWAPKCNIDKTKMHAHAFRHFFAKMYLKNNKDVVQLAELLGHGSVDTTRIYLQKSYAEQKKDFNRNVNW